jgi:hypothetical protein
MAEILARLPCHVHDCKLPIRDPTRKHRTVILSTARPTWQCQNFEMSVERQTAEEPDFNSLTRQHKNSVYRRMLRGAATMKIYFGGPYGSNS